MVKNIVIIGFMGTGKTSISKIISKKLNMKFLDIDTLIEKKENKNILEIFKIYGEEYFRKQETNILKSLLCCNNTIVSCGGGIILKEKNIFYLKQIGKVFWIISKPETIYERVKKENTRPILYNNMNVEYISRILERRIKKYEITADFKIFNEKKTLDEVSYEILEKIKKII